ncbi:S8 family serine peptidase [Arenimonas daejeonensis]|uniref:S8 family serine peptidase n=1 Tax=Arenimonas daejeonensis TaxID=370777 RepID=UPI001315073D|nr:S8 family serine peptidase [Arenimonas daejeonensis]
MVRLSRKLDRVEAEAFLEQLRADPAVEYAEPDLRMKPAYTPNDPLYSLQWHYNHPVGGINLPLAWDTSKGSGAVVAVLDTGITNHPDLNAQVLAGYDFIGDIATANDGNGRDNNPADPGDWVEADECEDGEEAEDSSWHGTHVAGTVAAHTNNGVGVAGVAPLAKIVPVRVLGKCGGFTSDIADAIVWASGGAVSGVPANANPAEVINLSLGGEGSCGTTYRNAINGAVARGSVVVVAAGNGNTSVESYTPASCPNVIAVASSDQDGTRSDFSNAGGLIDVTAPGGEGTTPDGTVGIASTADSGTTVPESPGYYYYQGTSMAAPHVAGVVALMQSLSPNTPAEVERILKLTSKPIAPFNCPGGCGAGKINAYAALRGVAGILPAAPIATLRNGTTISVPAGAAGTWTRFSLPNISRGMNLSFTLTGGTGNGDLYVKFGAPPTLTDYDCRSTNAGNSEVCRIPEMQEGNYYAYVRGATAHSGARLITSHYARVFLNREDVTIPDLGTAQSPILVLRRTGRALARTPGSCRGRPYLQRRHEAGPGGAEWCRLPAAGQRGWRHRPHHQAVLRGRLGRNRQRHLVSARAGRGSRRRRPHQPVAPPALTGAPRAGR